jgi:predicted DNA-binding protein (MmcQ/YjbR family)
VFALNHHGDGHVALWLNTPAIEQSRLIGSAPRHVYKPPYVGPSGWIGVELNRGFSWKRVLELVHMAYLNSSPARLAALVSTAPAIAAPTVKMKPADIDRMLAPKAQKLLARMRKVCLALPETEESQSFGNPVWRVGKKGFASLYDYGEGLKASFWVGIERQGPLEMDPRISIPAYMGHNGWIALDVAKPVSDGELRGFVIESYRHFATRRAIAKLR